jgi:hypothetical protein
MYVHIYTCIHPYLHIHRHVYTHTYTATHTHIHIHIYTQASLTLAVWLAIFVIYGCLSEQRMTFWTALYFAVSAISTGSAESLALIGPDTPHGNRVYFDEFNQARLAVFFLWNFVIVESE